MKQIPLIAQKSSTAHGGEPRIGKRKVARPICTKRPLHLVLKSSRAKGPWSFYQHKDAIKKLLKTSARQYGVRVLGYENVGNHLHLLIQGKNRPLLRAFLKVFPQRLMFQVTGARKGNPQGRFFDHILFSRVVEWGQALARMKNYLGKNRLESYGLPKDIVERWRHMNWGNGLFEP
jgi:hypothetical protein